MTRADDREPRAPGQHRLVVDRFEGELVVVEVDGGAFLDLPRWMLPPGVREGDVVLVGIQRTEGGERRLEFRVDSAATAAARGAVEDVLTRLRRRDPGGDIAL